MSHLSTKRISRTTLIVAAVLAVTAGGLASGMASAATTAAGPQHAGTTAAVPLASRAAATAPAGLPSRQQQIKVLTAALANMHKNFKTLEALAGGQFGPKDVFDYGVGDLWKQGIDGAGTTIAVLEGWDFPDVTQALAEFDKAYGLPAPPGDDHDLPGRPAAGRLPARHGRPGQLRVV